MRELQAIAIVGKYSSDKFTLSLLDFLIEKGFLTENQMEFIFREANKIVNSHYKHDPEYNSRETSIQVSKLDKPLTKRFKKKYRMEECEAVIKEMGLNCRLLRHTSKVGYLLTDGNDNEAIYFRTCKDFIVWALESPEHPLAKGVTD